MEKDIINAIKELTGTFRECDYIFLGNWFARQCQKRTNKWYSSNTNDYQISEGEYIGSIHMYDKEYTICKKHIEERDKNGLPFLVKFYEVDIISRLGIVIDTFYMI